MSPTAQTAASSGGASSGPDGAGPEWPRPALSDVLDLAVELRRRVELLEMEKEHLVRALQAAFEKVAELEGENWRLKEAAQFFEAAAEERERQLKDPMLDRSMAFLGVPLVFNMFLYFFPSY